MMDKDVCYKRGYQEPANAIDVRVILPSGGTLWCRSAVQPVLDAEQVAVRVVETLMDITERKEAEWCL